MANSHYVPRLILKRFNEKLSLYNVKTGELQENISVEHAYAQKDFYSQEIERKLNIRAESQFGNLFSNCILKCDKEIRLSREQLYIIKKFLLISVLRSVCGEEWMKTEKNFYIDLQNKAKDYADKLGFPYKEEFFQPPFQEQQIENETPFDYWMRTLEVVLDTNGTPNEILQHPMKTYPAHRWADLINSAYIAFWDAPDTGDEFVITDIGMTSENEKGWDGVYFHNMKKTGFFRELMEIAIQAKVPNNILSQIVSDCDAQNNFSENFMMFPISSKRMIVLISPFFKLKDRYSNFGIPTPKLDDLTCIPNEKLFEPNRNYYRLPQTMDMEHQYHEDDRYIYDIKVLTNSEIQYCNSLFMDRIDTYLGFASLDKAVNSIIRYKLLNSYPYTPRVNYTKLYREIEKRYGYKLFL